MKGRSEMKINAAEYSSPTATPELIRELFADDKKRGEFMILEKDKYNFIQVGGDTAADGFMLEYRECGKDGKLYHCPSIVTSEEAEAAFLDYLDGIETWKHRFEWEVEKGFGGAGGSGGRFIPRPVLFIALLAAVVAGVVYVGKLPRNMRFLPVAAVILPLLVFHILRWAKAKPEKFKTLEDLDDDDGGIDWRETGAKDVVVDTRDGWAVLMDNVPVHEAKAAAQALDGAHIRCRLEILSEDRAYHRYGNGGLGTRMCVLVAPNDYEKAKKLAL